MIASALEFEPKQKRKVAREVRPVFGQTRAVEQSTLRRFPNFTDPVVQPNEQERQFGAVIRQGEQADRGLPQVTAAVTRDHAERAGATVCQALDVFRGPAGPLPVSAFTDRQIEAR